MELEQIIAENLTELRKARNWTQQQLAEKINYSDKTVSKWERGDGLPDLRTTVRLAALFDVPVDCLLTEGGAVEQQLKKQPQAEKGYHICISLLAVLCMWIALAVAYAYIMSYNGSNLWILFIWGIPASCLLMRLLEHRYFRGMLRGATLPLDTLFCWSTLAATYLQLLRFNIWPLFIIGVPVQTALILWAYVRKKYRE